MTFYLCSIHSTLDKEHTNSTNAAAAPTANLIPLLTEANCPAEINSTDVMAPGDSSHFPLVSLTAVAFPRWAAL